jgi:hypothetical protein
VLTPDRAADFLPPQLEDGCRDGLFDSAINCGAVPATAPSPARLMRKTDPTSTARSPRPPRERAAAGILGTAPEDVDDDTARGLGSVVHALIAGLSLQAFLDPDSLPTGDQVAAALQSLANGRTSIPSAERTETTLPSSNV